MKNFSFTKKGPGRQHRNGDGRRHNVISHKYYGNWSKSELIKG